MTGLIFLGPVHDDWKDMSNYMSHVTANLSSGFATRYGQTPKTGFLVTGLIFLGPVHSDDWEDMSNYMCHATRIPIFRVCDQVWPV